MDKVDGQNGLLGWTSALSIVANLYEKDFAQLFQRPELTIGMAKYIINFWTKQKTLQQ